MKTLKKLLLLFTKRKPQNNVYLRFGGNNYFLRPDGVSFYKKS